MLLFIWGLSAAHVHVYGLGGDCHDSWFLIITVLFVVQSVSLTKGGPMRASLVISGHVSREVNLLLDKQYLVLH